MSEPTKVYFDEQFEQLTSAVKTGFDAVDKKFEEADKRFDAVDKKFEEVDKRFDNIENHLERAERKIDKAFIDGLDRHEKWIKQIADKVGVRLEV